MATTTFTWTLLLGALLAVPYALYASSSRRPPRLFALGLTVAASVYVLVAAIGGTPRDLLLEVGGAILFGAAAWIGARRLPWLLAVGWAGHVAWDLLLHPVEASGYAPWWYPVLCIGFDLIVAGFIVATCTSAPGVHGGTGA